MFILVKRVFGLVTLLTGGALLVFALGQKFFLPDHPFKLGPLIGGLVWGSVSWRFGRKWLFNWIDLDVIAVDPNDPAILAATEKARATLGVLWGYLDRHQHECFVKFPLQTKEGTTEHIWGVVHTREGDKVVVSLANEPVDEPSTSNDRRLIDVRDVEDWQVMVSPTEIHGGYSIAALDAIARSRGYSLSPKDRKALRSFVDVQELARS